MKSPDPAAPGARANYEQVQAQDALSFEDLSGPSAASKASPTEGSEALFKS
jgi:hypothetical protein